MAINFTKYQGTGNDFVIIDNRENVHNNLDVKAICDRKFGIGADGLMLLELTEGYDFKMVYYNSDGAISSMCGNGGRCLVHFAHSLGLFKNTCTFIAIDGEHDAEVIGDEVHLKMNDLSNIEEREGTCILNTGSPHFVKFVEKMPTSEFVREARSIRQSDEFLAEGINVNFVQNDGKNIIIRTFERGVEDETLSCGTGVTAAAIASHTKNNKVEGDFEYLVNTQGGNLKVSFNYQDAHYIYVWLKGPAKKVFEGTF